MRNLIQKILRLPKPPHESVSLRDALAYVIRRGLGAFVRGIFCKWKFGKCGKALLVGRNCQIYFPKQIQIGDHVHLGANLTLNGLSQQGIHIGNHVHIREYGLIQATSQLHEPGIGVVIEDDVYIGPHSCLGAGGGLKIGRGATIGAYVHCLAENHRFEDPNRLIGEQGVVRKGIEIGSDVWIGNQVVILDGVSIGAGSVIGAGSIVTRDIPAKVVACGNPAKVIKKRV